MTRNLLLRMCLLIAVCLSAWEFTDAQQKPEPEKPKLVFVVYVSRHGVRAPTGKAAQYNAYSAAPWPTWEVQPGYLTTHGYKLMQLFGAYDREYLASQGLLSLKGCADAAAVTIYADSDQRTRETGKALAEGLFPGCAVPVGGLPEGTNDPLFHSISANGIPGDRALAAAAVAGRMGGDAAALTEAYRPQIAALDTLLAGCGRADDAQAVRKSLFDVPASVSTGSGDHLVELRGPIYTASTLTENLLLAYTEGMEPSRVGWGCVDGAKVRSLIGLHTAATDFSQRTRAVALPQAGNLLESVVRSLQQATTGAAAPEAQGKPEKIDARDKPGARALFLVGHDTNLTNLAGALNLTWIEDGRRDDTPPGSALTFELWKEPKDGGYSVRVYFTAQTLEQMRSASVLTEQNPPQRVPVFLPGCSRADQSCSWDGFSKLVRDAVASGR